MQFDKPKVQRTYVQAIDRATRKSKSFTVYGVTPEQFADAVRRQFSEARAARRSRKEPVASA